MQDGLIYTAVRAARDQADDADGVVQLGIGGEFFGEEPLVFRAPVIKRMNINF